MAKKTNKKTALKLKKQIAKKQTVKIAAKKISKKAIKKSPKKPAPKTKSKPSKEKKPHNKIKNTTTKSHVKKSNKKSLAKAILDSKKKPKVLPEKTENHPLQQKIIKKFDDRPRTDRSKITFKVGDYAVYPSHGVGKIIGIEKTAILNQEHNCYLMNFEKEKLSIKIPIDSAARIGLRPLISKSQMDEVFSILRSGIKKLKGMWSRRAQEYETKINSGDIILLAEVLRDLTRDVEESERSYSERIIYETAIHRLASEYAVIYGINVDEAKEKIITTAKDKLGSEAKAAQKDEFDEFDLEDGEENEKEEIKYVKIRDQTSSKTSQHNQKLFSSRTGNCGDQRR